jgi:hypothetical protein
VVSTRAKRQLQPSRSKKREEYETNKRSRDRIDRRNYANREIMDEIKIDKRNDAKRKKRTMEWRKMRNGDVLRRHRIYLGLPK